ncbi:MAG TPA: HAD family phosphatase [Planctomycetota bacterium]|nr:HAD family phosphatase [Planctomycetota bacterium]
MPLDPPDRLPESALDPFIERASRARGVIFDFDGVLADSEYVHYRTFAATLETVGIHVSREEHDTIFLGLDDLGGFDLASRRAGRGPMPLELGQKLIETKSQLYTSALAEIPLFPGAREALDEAAARGPFTIASSGRRGDIAAVLHHHGLSERAPRFVSVEDVARVKPAPDCFLRALEILREEIADLRPEECLVFEDSYRGVEAAKNAGMLCVALCHSFPPEALTAADRIIESWHEWRWPDPSVPPARKRA